MSQGFIRQSQSQQQAQQQSHQRTSTAHRQLTPQLIAKYLHENNVLIQAIYENQNLGKLKQASQYQMKLQQNLIYLATIADMDPRKKKQ
ncbi:hypothetical protein AAMO2058_000648800 [Amorphochlora amoebiformis]